jgi:O-antigen/teichoic acid export membrane protein
MVPMMGSRVGKNSLYSLVGLLIPGLALLISAPLLIHRMGISGYGLWALAISFLGLIGVFDLGLSTATAKYVAQYHARGDAERLSATVTTGFAIYFVIGLLLTVTAAVLAPRLSSLFRPDEIREGAVVTDVIRLAGVAFVPLMVKNAALAVPVGLQRFKAPMFISILQTTLTYGLALVVAYGGGSILGIITSSVLALWLVSIVSLIVGYRMLRPLGVHFVLSRSQARLTARFVTYSSMSSAGSVLFSSLDRVVVGMVLGVSAVAYYTVIVGIATYLLSVADVLTRPLMPAVASWASTEQLGRVRRYLVRSTVLIAALECLAVGVLLLASRPFMTLWLGADFTAHALIPFRILVIVYGGVALCAPAYHVANGYGLPWLPAIGGMTGGVLSILCIWVLGQAWGLTGAAWANFAYWTNFVILVSLLRTLRHSHSADAAIQTRRRRVLSADTKP